VEREPYRNHLKATERSPAITKTFDNTPRERQSRLDRSLQTVGPPSIKGIGSKRKELGQIDDDELLLAKDDLDEGPIEDRDDTGRLTDEPGMDGDSSSRSRLAQPPDHGPDSCRLAEFAPRMPGSMCSNPMESAPWYQVVT
jgi:hypothetical protein